MRKQAPHISDEDLLRLLDGELAGRNANSANAHLSACWQCRTRRSQIESTIGEFIQIHDAVDLPPLDPSRNLFKARLRQVADSVRPSLWQRSVQFVQQTQRYKYAGLFALAFLTAATMIHFLLTGVEASAIPNSRLTPGVARAISSEELCSLPESRPASVPDRLAFLVFDKYGIHDPQPRTYEVDYLISPDLGGSEDIRNLWPEPYGEGVWNAHVKDALEDRLHELVCSGKLELRIAQRDISTNWVEAYKKYFHTELPLELHASFSKDAPWQ